jgi:hypothetical protein
MTVEREKADSEIRAKMFDFLLTRYFSAEQKASTSDPDDFRTRLMVLRLLLENFQEHFSSRALFAHLYRQIGEAEKKAKGDLREDWRTLKKELMDVGTNTASVQLTSLAPISMKIPGVIVPLKRDLDLDSRAHSNPSLETESLRIPLYSREGLTGGELLFQQSPDSGLPGEGDRPAGSDRYSVILAARDIKEDAATIRLWIQKDKYVSNEYDPVQSGKEPLLDLTFDASFFSTPYLDNTLLPDGTRFSVIYRGCMDSKEKDFECRFPLKKDHQPQAQFDVVIFKSGFLNLRDRPGVEALLRRDKSGSSWWNFR